MVREGLLFHEDTRRFHEVIRRRVMEFDAVSKEIIGCAIEVHRQPGPGLLESAYEECLIYELSKKWGKKVCTITFVNLH